MKYVESLRPGIWGSVAVVFLGVAPALAWARPDCQAEDERAVLELDTQYQEAVKTNDAEAIERLLPDDFVLITGRGTALGKSAFVADAQTKDAVYEHQEDSSRTVRVFGDTAVLTALLWAKGTSGGSAFDYKLWFSDVYVRTPHGWRYTFAQASTILPNP